MMVSYRQPPVCGYNYKINSMPVHYICKYTEILRAPGKFPGLSITAWLASKRLDRQNES